MKWLPRTGRVRCFCGAMFWRQLKDDYRTCLKCQTRKRLSWSGITWSDPALAAIAAYNAAAQARAGITEEKAA